MAVANEVNGDGSSHQVLDFTAKSKFTAVRWCILMMNTSVLVNIQGDERLILNLHLN